MSNVVFLANTVDPSTSTTFYGVGHQGSFTDEAQVALWNAQGKVALLGSAPRNPRVTAIGTTTATIVYEVDQACTSSRVEYGTTTAYGSQQAGSPATGGGTVTVNLTGLTTGTTYNYRIVVVTGSNTSATGNFTLRTN